MLHLDGHVTPMAAFVRSVQLLASDAWPFLAASTMLLALDLVPASLHRQQGGSQMFDDEETGLVEQLLRTTSGRAAMSTDSSDVEDSPTTAVAGKLGAFGGMGEHLLGAEHGGRWSSSSSPEMGQGPGAKRSSPPGGGVSPIRGRRGSRFLGASDSGEDEDEFFVESRRRRGRPRKGLSKLLVEAFREGDETEMGLGSGGESRPLLGRFRSQQRRPVGGR